jgi:isoleucyl-tRNA synthetase
LAEDGQKMSKSKNNFPPLLPMIDKYGVDALRYFMASSPAVKAEDIAFSEKGVDEVNKKLIQRLDNVLSFYELYSSDSKYKIQDSSNVLDKWIIARLNELVNLVTENLEKYQLDKASRPIMDFVDDLSTWYLRRSRDRFKSDDAEDKNNALSTMRYVLCELAKVMAPFTPFYAEYLYKKLSNDKESVHLESWPTVTGKNQNVLIGEMAQVRKISSLGLEARMRAKINVRQPLLGVKLKTQGNKLGDEMLSLIKDELNVKSVEYAQISEEVELNTTLTQELKEEGNMRELVRAIQELRKTDGLTVGDKVVLVADTDAKGKELLEKYKKEIMRITLVTGITYHSVESEKIKIDDYIFSIGLKK